jgi:hypothetical protein
VHFEARPQVTAGFHAAGCDHWQDKYCFLRAVSSYADVLDRGFVIRRKKPADLGRGLNRLISTG